MVYTWASWLQEQEEIWVRHAPAPSPQVDDGNSSLHIVEAETTKTEDRGAADDVQRHLVSKWRFAAACQQCSRQHEIRTCQLRLFICMQRWDIIISAQPFTVSRSTFQVNTPPNPR